MGDVNRTTVICSWERRRGEAEAVAPFLRSLPDAAGWRGLWARSDTADVADADRQALDDAAVGALLERARRPGWTTVSLWNGESDEDLAGGLALTIERVGYSGLSSLCVVDMPAAAGPARTRQVLRACVQAWDPLFARSTVRALEEAQDYAADGVGVLTYVRDRGRLPTLPAGIDVEALGPGAVLALPAPDVDLAQSLRTHLQDAGALPPEPPTSPLPSGA